MEHVANSLWSGAFAVAFGVLLTSPLRGLVACALCGLSGRLVRDLFMLAGVTLSWATVLGATVIVLVAVLTRSGRHLVPVAIVCGVFPLGAAQATFEAIIGLLQLASLEGAALPDAAIQFVATAGRAFTVTLAQAVGLALGLGLVHGYARLAGRS